MNKRRAILFDSTKCLGCGSCYLACKEKNKLPETSDDPLKDKLSCDTYTILKESKGAYYRKMCMHCEVPTCVAVCPVGAFKKTPEGPVIYDSSKCMGCRYCMQACPFQIPTYEWDELFPKVHKCKMCYDRVKEGQEPACTEACPTGASVFGFRDELITEAKNTIATNPTEYVNHIYGEKEVGGTSVLHMSKVPFKELGYKTELGTTPLPELTWAVLSKLPNVVMVGGVFLFGMHWLTNRKNEMEELDFAVPPKNESASNIPWYKNISFPKLTFWKIIFAIIMILGIVATVMRFTMGLGATTNLSDQFPWGLWIGFDILCGVGLAAGGFTLCAMVYLFHLKRFQPLVRPAILTAFLGYLLVVFALFFDLGLPHRIWHPMIMWNPHSVMFEVGWCVTLYTTVLALEFSPILFEKLGWKKPWKFIHEISIVLVMLGVLLSTLHQSSLGTLFLTVPNKLYPLWYSSLLPVYFFLSAVGIGCAMVIIESYISSRVFKKELELDILSDLGKGIVICFSIYLVVKIIDFTNHDKWNLLLVWNSATLLFIVEMLLSTILPIILLSFSKIRESRTGLFWSAIITLLGFILNRLNVGITGIQMNITEVYFPSWQEIFVSLAIVAFGFGIYSLAVQYLPIFSTVHPHEHRDKALGIKSISLDEL